METAVDDLPDVGAVLAPLLQRVPAERQPLLIALAERMAAVRYRTWAADPTLVPHRSALLACALREEDIAARVEALRADSAAIEQELQGDGHLEEVDRRVFAGLPLRAQLTVQMRGERLGAATWRAFAREAPEPARRVFLACADLEEASAAVLETILAGSAS
jgi:hypothetical protein